MHPPRPPVSLDDLVEALELQNDSVGGFVLPDTAEVILVSDEALAAAESPDRASEVDEAELEEAQRVLAASNRLPLPDRFEVDEYHMMVRFADARPAASEREELRDDLRGSGAFRRFKDGCHSLGLAQAWYAYRDAEYEALAVQWCDSQGLTWTRKRDSRAPDT